MQDSITHEALEALTNPREVLEEAWNAIHDYQKAPWQPLAVGNGMERFRRFLDAEAWTDAAMMLVPEGWSWSIGELRGIGAYRAFLNDHNTPDGKAVRHVCEDNKHHPALALAQACLKARENSDG